MRRQHQRRVSGVDAGVLDVLRDGRNDEIAAARDGVQLELSRVVEKFADDYGMPGRHRRRTPEKLVELDIVGRYAHGGAAQHVRGPYQHRVTDAACKFQCVVGRDQFLPRGLFDSKLVEQARELVPVLRGVDAGRRRAKETDPGLGELQGKVVRTLTAHRQDHAERPFAAVDLQHRLEGDLLEIQPVAFVVIGADGFRIMVDHDGLVAHPV